MVVRKSLGASISAAALWKERSGHHEQKVGVFLPRVTVGFRDLGFMQGHW